MMQQQGYGYSHDGYYQNSGRYNQQSFNQYSNGPYVSLQGSETRTGNGPMPPPPAPPPPLPVLDVTGGLGMELPPTPGGGVGKAIMVSDLEQAMVKDQPKNSQAGAKGKKGGKEKGAGKGKGQAGKPKDANKSPNTNGQIAPQQQQSGGGLPDPGDGELADMHKMYQQLLQAKGTEYDQARLLLQGRENELTETNSRISALEAMRDQLRAQLKPYSRKTILSYYQKKPKTPKLGPPTSPSLTPEKTAPTVPRATAPVFVPSQNAVAPTEETKKKQFTITDPGTGRPIASPQENSTAAAVGAAPVGGPTPTKKQFVITDPKTGKAVGAAPFWSPPSPSKSAAA